MNLFLTISVTTVHCITGQKHDFAKSLRYYLIWLFRTLKGNRNWFDIVRVRYIRTFIKAYQVKGKYNTVRYSGNSLYPEFDIAKFDCMYAFCVWGRFGRKNIFQAFFIVQSFAFALS